jgi:NAD+ diphosphatase
MAMPKHTVFKSLRLIMREGLDENLALVASRAIHIADWRNRNKYCGVCGGLTEKNNTERARKCPSCGNVIYPRISPAIIIAVVKGDKLLLAHNKGFKEHWYSTVAGFMEPGESIEACAEREVLEEVGIKIKNIKYFASQPWPFPDSLMIGLTAEYESGEVTPDGVEIDDADFFSADGLPETPGRSSVAGRLIEWFKENHK